METELLTDWFRAEGRDLPWRRPECDGWGVLVSEIMLQQTPVKRVLPAWEAWLRDWPKPSDCAAASQGQVLRAWGKLGYPRRALRLHESAAAIAREHGDVVPEDVDTLLTLPGIGTYTARAVAAFAYRKRVPVVDTNVRRVVARSVHGLADSGAPSANRDLADVDALLPPEDEAAAVVSAAIMELGALRCTARTPGCGDCPIEHGCAWVRAGKPDNSTYTKPVQAYAGTDRHVRGLLLDVLRGTDTPVPKTRLDLAWPKGGQRDRCLDTLLTDGLVEQLADGRFALPGEHRPGEH
ncbi:A/G-specific adenine glycosylase [Sciscionella marina]|uniref:A/G-specific adenine glycosylase n=1 Tax=Sciscionella marina TaxID=508770 RepID=UPI000360EDC4|nr:A/G-specific adenine glycosylase [Sciscionella marina]